MAEDKSHPPLVELIDEPPPEDPWVKLTGGKAETPHVQLVDLVDSEGDILTGVKEEVAQLLWGGTEYEQQTREGTQIDVNNMCRILGIDRSLPESQVKSAFRAAIRRFHPDILQQAGVDKKDSHDLGWRMTQLKEKLGI